MADDSTETAMDDQAEFKADDHAETNKPKKTSRALSAGCWPLSQRVCYSII